MRFLGFFICILFNVGLVTAQASDTPEPFRIGASLGCSFTGYRDEVEAPINRYLNTLTYIIDGNIEKGSFLHSFDISFFMGDAKMAAPYKGYIHKRYISARGTIEYALDYRLWGSQTFPGYLGGAFRTVIHYTGVDVEEYLTPPTGVGLFSLDLHATQKWNINVKNALVFSVGCPIFGYAIRPPYVGQDEIWGKYLSENPLKIITLGEVTSFHNYWGVYGDLKYQYMYNTQFSVYSGLGFELSRISFPRTRVDALFRLNTGIALAY